MTRKDRKIISNDDGWIMSNMTSTVTPDTIKELMVDTYPGSPIGGVSWCVGNSETYEHETEVGERTGDGYEHFEDERDLLAAQEPLQPDRELRRAAYGDHAAVPRGGHRRAAVDADEQPLRHRVRLAGSRQVSPGASRLADRPAE